MKFTFPPTSSSPAVDCVWRPWSDWSQCNRLCGGGQQFRSRDKLLEQYGGTPCEGEGHETRNCNTHHCPSEQTKANINGLG